MSKNKEKKKRWAGKKYKILKGLRSQNKKAIIRRNAVVQARNKTI